VNVHVEFLCETDAVDPGRIFRPKGAFTGSKVAAFNVRGAQLAPLDFIERDIEGERLDGGVRSRVAVRIANLLPYVVLKVLAFQDRHENKDAYDLVFTLLHYGAGPREAGVAASVSPVSEHPQVRAALALMKSGSATRHRTDLVRTQPSSLCLATTRSRRGSACRQW